MSLWIAIIIGIIEGLTEFLPVSSTGHMIIAGHAMNFTGTKAETFEVVIQLGAILAVAVLYWKRVLRLFGIQDQASRMQTGPRLNLIHIAIGIVPALGVGYIFKDYIKLLFMPETVIISLVVGGIFMIVAEKWQPKVNAETMDQITYGQAFYIGLSQLLSLWPGFSRSGSTIAGGMLAGTSRAAAADFTFLMAIPIMTVVTGYEMLHAFGDMSRDDIVFFLVGFVMSFVVALLAVATFIKLVGRLKLTVFSYYRFVLAFIVFLYFIVF
jgi:undecaprenyl-diphosphatase